MSSSVSSCFVVMMRSSPTTSTSGGGIENVSAWAAPLSTHAADATVKRIAIRFTRAAYRMSGCCLTSTSRPVRELFRFAPEHPVREQGIGDHERQDDTGADKDEAQRLGCCGRLPDGHAIHDEIRVQAVCQTG